MAIIAAAAAVAKTEAVKKVSEGIAGLFGPTATDRRRVEAANNLTAEAVAGSDAALGELIRQAYERKPDGKYSPQAVRDLAVKGLRQYVQAKGGLPEKYAAYAARLQADIIPAPTGKVETFVREVVGDAVRQGTAQAATGTAQDVTRRYGPWVVGGVLVIVALVVILKVKR